MAANDSFRVCWCVGLLCMDSSHHRARLSDVLSAVDSFGYSP